MLIALTAPKPPEVGDPVFAMADQSMEVPYKDKRNHTVILETHPDRLVINQLLELEAPRNWFLLSTYRLAWASVIEGRRVLSNPSDGGIRGATDRPAGPKAA